jgi:hypothetical protein
MTTQAWQRGRAGRAARRRAAASIAEGKLVEPADVIRLVEAGIVLPEHLDLFERGVAKKLDSAYSGPPSSRIASMLFGGGIDLGAVHTHLELFARYFIDLTPHVALIAAVRADRAGNLYTGPDTEDTPTIVEATAFKDGVVIAQVNEIVEARLSPGGAADLLAMSLFASALDNGAPA